MHSTFHLVPFPTPFSFGAVIQPSFFSSSPSFVPTRVPTVSSACSFTSPSFVFRSLSFILLIAALPFVFLFTLFPTILLLYLFCMFVWPSAHLPTSLPTSVPVHLPTFLCLPVFLPNHMPSYLPILLTDLRFFFSFFPSHLPLHHLLFPSYLHRSFHLPTLLLPMISPLSLCLRQPSTHIFPFPIYLEPFTSPPRIGLFSFPFPRNFSSYLIFLALISFPHTHTHLCLLSSSFPLFIVYFLFQSSYFVSRSYCLHISESR